MIWVILAALGVPLWLCAVGIFALLFQNRALKKRPGNIPVRVRPAGKNRWSKANALWLSDIFFWRGSLGVWKEGLDRVVGASARPADLNEQKKLHRLGEGVLVATLRFADGGSQDVAGPRELRGQLLGPFASPASDQLRNSFEHAPLDRSAT